MIIHTKMPIQSQSHKILKPNWMLAELTYACPLSCGYCSNPTDIASRKTELSTKVWKKCIENGGALGISQIGFSGGEPLMRKDLEILVETAVGQNMYTNLITSAIGLTHNRLNTLKNIGLDSIQVSFQADTKDLNDYIAKNNVFETKYETAKAIKAAGFPLTFNIVLHRMNADRIDEILHMAINDLGADFIELANVQFHGWAFSNKEVLLPTKAQLEYTKTVAAKYIEKYKDRVKILYVISDYYEGRPKPCMGGWANDLFMITPDGYILPCHSARLIPNLEFPQISENNILDLSDIWYNSQLFNAFRGTDWMPEPCNSCDEKYIDFGGCRCQAMMLLGDASATDPVCNKSPHNETFVNMIDIYTSGSLDTSKLKFRDRNNK